MASETTASHNTQSTAPTPARPPEPPEVDDGLMSSQRQRYLMALQQEELNHEQVGQSDTPPPEQ